MAIITAYKCEVTGKIFEEETQYTRHTKKLLAEQRKREKIIRKELNKEKWWQNNFWNRVKSIAQLKAAILQHSDVLAKNGLEKYWPGDKKLLATPVVNISIDLSYSKQVSNTHSCPHNGVTNFCRNKDFPQSYPGLIGRIDYSVRTYKDQTYRYPGSSDMWSGTRIHTCSGGGGGSRMQKGILTQSFGYGVTLFFDDWPAMANEYEKAMIWIALNDSKHANVNSLVNKWNPASAY